MMGPDPDSYFPTRIFSGVHQMSPKTLRSHNTTAMTTTAFKIALMEPAIGMQEFDKPEANTNYNQNQHHVD